MRHDLSVRTALGAGHDRALLPVMKEGVALVAFGPLIPLPGVHLGGHLLQGMVFGVSPFDPFTLSGGRQLVNRRRRRREWRFHTVCVGN
jgi:hypothetical protein